MRAHLHRQRHHPWFCASTLEHRLLTRVQVAEPHHQPILADEHALHQAINVGVVYVPGCPPLRPNLPTGPTPLNPLTSWGWLKQTQFGAPQRTPIPLGVPAQGGGLTAAGRPAPAYGLSPSPAPPRIPPLPPPASWPLPSQNTRTFDCSLFLPPPPVSRILSNLPHSQSSIVLSICEIALEFLKIRLYSVY
jgi:hypothetical protein